MARWYTVYTKPRKEPVAEENLRRQGYEVYLPRLQRTRRRRNRWVEVIEPLFPRYLFTWLQEGQDNFAPIRSTFGVIDLVRFGGAPQPVPEGLVETIQNCEDQQRGCRIARKPLQRGRKIEILEGPFAGLKGVFEAEKAGDRVVILLQLLGRDSRITLARDAVVPA